MKSMQDRVLFLYRKREKNTSNSMNSSPTSYGEEAPKCICTSGEKNSRVRCGTRRVLVH